MAAKAVLVAVAGTAGTAEIVVEHQDKMDTAVAVHLLLVVLGLSCHVPWEICVFAGAIAFFVWVTARHTAVEGAVHIVRKDSRPNSARRLLVLVALVELVDCPASHRAHSFGLSLPAEADDT